MAIVYPFIAEQINQGRVGFDTFIDGIFNFIALRDPSVSIIDIGSGYKRYVTQKLSYIKDASVGYQRRLRAVSTETGTGNWNLNVYVDNNQGSQYVVKLSSRTIGTIARNYITSGIVLRKWLAELE
jgi:hypothetical protein